MRTRLIPAIGLFVVLANAVLANAPIIHSDPSHPAPRPEPRGLNFEPRTFEFPGAGQRNNNQTIGDFCCTGETATIRTAEGKTAGFIYFYDFRSGINLKPDAAAADQFSLLVSGVTEPSRLDSGRAGRVQSSHEFDAKEMKPGLSRKVVAGALEFTVTIQDVKFIDEAHSRFWMNSIKIKVDVQEALP
jgi:hypothetical protein